MTYAAFISYSREDADLAAGIQRGLQQFAKPWYRIHALSIFRDKTDLYGTVLGSAIEEALLDSRYLILLGSPASAQSEWVTREVEYWLNNKNANRIIIVAAKGKLSWDKTRNDFDWNITDCVPRRLSGKFQEEPLYIDLRGFNEEPNLDNESFKGHICDLAAPLHGKSQEALAGEAARQHRSTMRLATGTGLIIAVLLATAVFVYFMAEEQRDLKEEASNLEAARQLVEDANSVRTDHPDLLARSVLLAAEAARLEPSLLDANSALRAAMSLFPKELITMKHDASITDIAFHPDGERILSASEDGTVRIWNLTTGEEERRLNHGSEVNIVEISPDGNWVATGSGTGRMGSGRKRDNSARVWDLATGALVFRTPQVDYRVSTVAFSPDGKLLATSDDDYSAAVWNIESKQQLVTLKNRGGSVGTVAFSGDGELLLMKSGNDGSVWNWRQKRRLITFNHNRDNTSYQVNTIVLSKLGNVAASASLDDSARIWDVLNNEEPIILKHGDNVQSVSFNESSDHIITASDDGRVRIWSTAGREILSLNHGNAVAHAEFSPTGNYALSADGKGVIRIWDIIQGAEIARGQHGDGRLAVAKFGSTDNLFATASRSTGRVWKVENSGVVASALHDGSIMDLAVVDEKMFSAGEDGKLITSYTRATSRPVQLDFDDAVRHVRLTSDKKYLLAATHEGAVHVQDGATRELLQILTHDQPIIQLEIAPNNEQVLTVAYGDRSASFSLWDLESGQRLWEKPGVHVALDTTFHPNGQVFATAGRNTEVRIWATENGEHLHTAKHDDSVSAVAYSPDGRYLASAGLGTSRLTGPNTTDNTVRVWNTQNNYVEIARFDHDDIVTDVAYSPNGEWLASTSNDSRVRLWRVGSDNAPKVLLHELPPGQVVFSQDSRYLATGGARLRESENPVVSIWRVEDGLELARLLHDSPVQRIALSPDGEKIATGTVVGHARMQAWQSTALVAEGCRRTGRNLTYEEVQKYLDGVIYRRTCKDLPIHPTVLEKAESLARTGKIKQAVEIYKTVNRIDGTADIRPNQEAARHRAEGLLSEAAKTIKKGNTTEALKLLEAAKAQSPKLEGTYRVWNTICWSGALNGVAASVLGACDGAVTLSDENGRVHDSRALVRALSGDLAGAARDLQAAVDWSYVEEERQASQGIVSRFSPKHFREERARWLELVESGENPYDEALLQRLRVQ